MKIFSQKIIKRTSISDLHEFIVLSILCFLPARYIIRCRCVCKDWANLIFQPYFLHEYISRGKAPVQLVIESDNNLFLAQLDEDLYTTRHLFDLSIPRISFFDLNIRRVFDYLYPSSLLLDVHIFTCQITGWIVSLRHREDTHRRQLVMYYHMYNPITGQKIVVPQCKDWRGGALIFSQKTNQLKMLEFCHNDQGRREANVQTIGTDMWRSIGEVPSGHYGFEAPVLVNGHCHWFDKNNRVIHSFNVEEEVFQATHEGPQCFKNYVHPNLGLLHGCLCLTTHSDHTEVWIMNEYGIQESWTKTFDFPDVPFVKSLTCLKNGEILMLGDGEHFYQENKYAPIICYNPRSGKCRRINIHDEVKEVGITCQSRSKKKMRKNKHGGKEKKRNFKFF